MSFPMDMNEKQSDSVLGHDTDDRHSGLFERLRNYLLAGILVTAPIGITVYLTWIFLQFVDSKVTPLIPLQYNPNTYLPFSFPGLGLICVALFFILVGWFARNFLGRLIIRGSEYFVHRMPVIRTLYGALKQIFETIMARQSQAFREVVMLEYPRKGVWSIGFVTGTTKGEIQRTTARETLNVFVPTTPEPDIGLFAVCSQRGTAFSENDSRRRCQAGRIRRYYYPA